ncbi:hypothetical protein B0T17DRAFT_186310 [Bombardia bombarda]|uniref:Uncharacterized protein n=1 Tax=Bombardia bombarda TaxID=252184 RepID=A0AA40C8T9_9PEZI|nr:hypothetical protein B0T17DRAFT_186310 [Bombardia bombarda]
MLLVTWAFFGGQSLTAYLPFYLWWPLGLLGRKGQSGGVGVQVACLRTAIRLRSTYQAVAAHGSSGRDGRYTCPGSLMRPECCYSCSASPQEEASPSSSSSDCDLDAPEVQWCLTPRSLARDHETC